MAIYHPIEGRSKDWFRIRLGKPTASEFGKIVTAGGIDGKKAKISEQAVGYSHQLLAELMLGRSIDNDVRTGYMQRGEELEGNAIQAYEFARNCDTELGGFVTDDGNRYGCSPDQLVGDAGLLEMKIPAANTHIRYLMDPAAIKAEKRPQAQGQLLVCEREWVDLVSYHPELPIAIVKVYRDEDYIGLLRAALDTFCETLLAQRLHLERDYGPFPDLSKPAGEPAEDFQGMGVTEDDVEAIWAAEARQ